MRLAAPFGVSLVTTHFDVGKVGSRSTLVLVR